MRIRYAIAVLGLSLAAMSLLPDAAQAWGRHRGGDCGCDGGSGGYGGGYGGYRGRYAGGYYGGGYAGGLYGGRYAGGYYPGSYAAGGYYPNTNYPGNYNPNGYMPGSSMSAYAPSYPMPAGPTDNNIPATSVPTNGARTLEVAIQDGAFEPAKLDVAPGTVVRWTNRGTVVHTVTSRDGQWTSPDLQPGGTFSMTFVYPGTYNYFCRPHAEKMQASITVGPNELRPGNPNINIANPVPLDNLPANATILTGEVVRVVGTDQVIVKNSAGQEVAVFVNPQTKLEWENKTVGVSEFRPGATVNVQYDVRENRNVARHITGAPKRNP